MTTFSDALASIGPITLRLESSCTELKDLGSSPIGSANKSLDQPSNFHTLSWTRKNNPEDDLSRPTGKPLKTRDPNAPNSDFNDALTSLGQITARLTASYTKIKKLGSSPIDSANKSLNQDSNFRNLPYTRKCNPEDDLSRPTGKPLKTSDPNAPKSDPNDALASLGQITSRLIASYTKIKNLGSSPVDSANKSLNQPSVVHTASEKPVFSTSSSQVIPPSRKRKADDGLPNPSKKPVRTRAEGGPRAGSASMDCKIAGNSNKSQASSTMSSAQNNTANAGTASKDPILAPNSEKAIPSFTTSSTLKNISKASSTLKGTRLVSKSDKPNLTITTSTPSQKGKTSPGDLGGALQDPNSPPPKRGSYRELMSRKASDMPCTTGPVYTGKQIKEAAKRNRIGKGKQTTRVYHSSYYDYKAPQAPKTGPTDPNAKNRSPEEKQKIAEARKRLALQRANHKFPRRAYNGTGAVPAQSLSRGTTAPVETAAPLVHTTSSTSASSRETSDNEMVAGYLDVEEEESRAARSAKKEDEEEARLEAELKRAKERRKMRLALDSRGKK